MLTTEPGPGSLTNGGVPERRADLPGGGVALGVAIALWVYLVVKYLRQRVILSFDTVNNYAHVWYVSDRIYEHGTLPLRMPILGGGRAFAFPYGFIPWTTAALFRPVLGDWVVGLWMVIGAAGMIGGTFFAFPELRRGWWATAVLINPAIVEGLLFGQLTFEWAGALVLFGIGCWRRGRTVWAILLVGAGQATHPAIVLPMVGLLALTWVWFEPDRRAFIRAYVLSTIVALPAAILVFASPTSSDATWRDILVNFICTLAPRSLLLIVPMVLTVAVHHRDRLPARRERWLAPGLVAIVIVVNLGLQLPLRVGTSWNWLHREPDAASSMTQFLRAGHFEKDKTYRVLRNGDVKYGMYLLLKAGGRLDSEFFPESQAIRSFSSTASYEELLCERHVDYVVAFASYDRRQRTNEHQLLDELAAATAEGGARVTKVRSVSRNDTVELFSVDRAGCSGSTPG